MHILLHFPLSFFVNFLSPQLFWHCFHFFRCFPVTTTPLFQNTHSCSFISLTMTFPSFTVVFFSTSHDLCFSSGLFILFCFSYSSFSLLLFHTDSFLSLIFFPLCSILFIYFITTSFLLFLLFLHLYMLSLYYFFTYSRS